MTEETRYELAETTTATFPGLVHEDAPADDGAPGDPIVGSSPAFRDALRELDAILESAANVLLLGESGTGKELLARTIHQRGRRRHSPFVAVNCAALPGDLVESELFGHAAGAFSGAGAARRGLIEVGHGGTLLLDEIGELPPALQAKLLRVLDLKELRRIGETTVRRIDFRLVAATNRDLRNEVANGRFRLDLFHRINTFTLALPALRDRPSDIPTLARHFSGLAASRHGRPDPGIAPAAIARLLAHDWPGNVRELANVVEKAALVARGGPIEREHLGLDQRPGLDPAPGALRDALARLERDMVHGALAANGGNLSAAARDLGIARQQAQRLVRRHGLEPAAALRSTRAPG